MTDDPLLPQATDDPTIVAGRYELERSLGTGGMGEVFVATDRTLDRPVALKRLPGALTDDPDARKRFFREAQALARINDPNVVSVFDAGEDDGRPFLVMELVQGATVADELRAGARRQDPQGRRGFRPVRARGSPPSERRRSAPALQAASQPRTPRVSSTAM